MSKLRNLLFFDFDQTLVKSTCDYLVRDLIKDEIVKKQLITELEVGRDWTRHIKAVYEQLFKEGTMETELREVLSKVPLVEGMYEAVRELRSTSEMYVVSDCNEWTIKEVLKRQGEDMRPWFKAVISNKGYFDGGGRFVYAPYCEVGQSGCKRCVWGLCKGAIVRGVIRERWWDERGVLRGEEHSAEDVAVEIGGFKNERTENIHKFNGVKAREDEMKCKCTSQKFVTNNLVAFFGDGIGDLCGCLALPRGPNYRSMAFVRDVGDLINHTELITAAGIDLCTWNTGGDLSACLKDYVL